MHRLVSHSQYFLLFFSLFLSIFFVYALCAFPSADDWGYGVMQPLEAWKHYYENYHGRYFSNYLISWIMNREDFIFSYRFFFFFSYTLLFTSIIIINSIFFGNKKLVHLTSLLLIAALLFRLPGKDNSYYWLAAHSNYLFSVSLLLASFLLFLLSKRIRSFFSYPLALLSAFLSFLSIGCNEFFVIYVPLLWCLLLFLKLRIFAVYRESSFQENHALPLLILFSFLGSFFAYLAPGHSVRPAGPPSSLFELSYLAKIIFLSPVDFLKSLIRLLLNPLFLLSLPLLSYLYSPSEKLKEKFKLLRPHRHTLLLFFFIVFLSPFILARVQQTHIASRALVPHYFLLAFASYILLFLYGENLKFKNWLNKGKALYLPALLLSLLASMPFQMWLDLPLAIKFREVQGERMRLIEESYSKDLGDRVLYFDRMEKPVLLSFHDIQDKEDKYYFVGQYYKFMKIKEVVFR